MNEFTDRAQENAEHINPEATASKYMEAMRKIGAYMDVMGTIGAIHEGKTYEAIKGGVSTLYDAGLQVQMKMAVKEVETTSTKFMSKLMPCAGIAISAWSFYDNYKDLGKAVKAGNNAMIAFYSIEITFDVIIIVLNVLELVLGPVATAIQVAFGILSRAVGAFFMSFYEEFKDFKINCIGDVGVMFLKIGKALEKGAVNFLTGGLWSSIEAFDSAQKQHFKFVHKIRELGDVTTFYKVP